MTTWCGHVVSCTVSSRSSCVCPTHSKRRALEGLPRNLLGVILNYADFAAEDVRAFGPELAGLVTDIEQIARAARRGADLTHQLLAFARREITGPKVLDLNHTVAEVEQLLRRAIGEHITLTNRPADTIPAVTIDPGQLEQVLVNLAVNARDAMPTGGHLTIDTAAVTIDPHDATDANLTPGTYVRLRVSDTGTGMPKDVVERAFDPFFTTKPTGQGTGLGLATVHGIVNRAGGTIQIYSEPGIGTTINILLPATHATPDTTDQPIETREPGHGETILVVEDEPALREVTCRILTTAGYHVLPAEDGAAARATAATYSDSIQLLLTDVVMPNMLGKELADPLTAERPSTKVIYMSGYAQPVLASQGTLDPNVTLIEKPFTRAELLATIRRQLDQPPRS
jgi:two-component system cell cycle sensor histidine kinase/response regulator CckA